MPPSDYEEGVTITKLPYGKYLKISKTLKRSEIANMHKFIIKEPEGSEEVFANHFAE